MADAGEITLATRAEQLSIEAVAITHAIKHLGEVARRVAAHKLSALSLIIACNNNYTATFLSSVNNYRTTHNFDRDAVLVHFKIDEEKRNVFSIKDENVEAYEVAVLLDNPEFQLTVVNSTTDIPTVAIDVFEGKRDVVVKTTKVTMARIMVDGVETCEVQPLAMARNQYELAIEIKTSTGSNVRILVISETGFGAVFDGFEFH